MPIQEPHLDDRIDALCSITEWSRYYAIGFVTVWLAAAARLRVERGNLDQLSETLPPHSDSRMGTCIALMRSGYITAGTGPSDRHIVDIIGTSALRKKRQMAGRKGAQATHAKKRKRAITRKRREAQQPEQQIFSATHDATVDGIAIKRGELLLVNPKPPLAKKKIPESAPFWEAYTQAYLERYRVMPLRNQKVNGQMVSLMQRIPRADLADFLRFYLTHEDYASSRHTIGAALSQAEKLHTDFLEGRATTHRDIAQQARAHGFASQMQRIERGEVD